VATRRPPTGKKATRFVPKRTGPLPRAMATQPRREPIPLSFPGILCFGCSLENPQGLGLRFYKSGDSVVSEFVPAAHLQGWYGTMHGGILATLLDELGAWTVAGLLRRIGVTRDLEVHFRRPMYVEEPIKMVGEVVEEQGQLAKVRCQLQNAKGDVCVEGEVAVFMLTEEQFVRMVPEGKVPAGLKPYFLAR